MTITIRVEVMGPHFTKYHIEGLPVPAVLHHIAQAEPEADPHDHPWGFTSFVIAGGYEEQIFDSNGDFYYAARRPGDTFDIAASHIHRITYLFSGGPCWSLILPGSPERKPGFYRWDENGQTLYRPWDREDFQPMQAVEGGD